MNDSLLWYSRYSVWVGAIVLVVQSVTGRSVAAISLLGVLMLAVGFVSFVGALSYEGLLRSAVPLAAESVAAKEPVLSPPAVLAVESVVAPAAESRLPITLQTQRLAADSPLVGASCAVCAKRLTSGQVIVRCPECGAVQHASCWTDHGFACAVENCGGRGSLTGPA